VKNYVVYKEKYLLGDIHGEWSVILNHLHRVSEFDLKEKDKVCYIQVGDFGMGYNTKEKEFAKLKILNEELVKHNSDLFIIRGNHDDPEWFVADKYAECKEELTNIFFVPDYTVLNIDLENILFVGGAVSIDRNYNKMYGGKYWEKEVVNFDFELVKNLRDIDRMICHTSPDFVEPLTFNNLVYRYAMNDDLLLADLTTERGNMTKLVTEVMNNNKLKGFYYGHFHRNYRFYHNDCEFVCLDINTFKNV
jgi:UDP-2,3-diacylglucosamine pyrophosphatase LpxH